MPKVGSSARFAECVRLQIGLYSDLTLIACDFGRKPTTTTGMATTRQLELMGATRQLTYDVDGLTMVAHLACPPGEGPWPAVLIGHDGIGLDDYQRRRADDLAAHGYLALAMDYHVGQLFFGRPEAMLARVMPLFSDAERMQGIGRAALDVLLAVPGVDADRLAALGYGAGGRIVLELASAHSRAWRAVLDLFDETFGTLPETALT
jgi:hypothetical protein